MPKPMYVWSGSAWVSVATEVESLATYATQSYADSQPGLKMVVPTSVAVGSGSGSVGTSGVVTFSGASSVSLNGCFTSTYNNYKIIVKTSSNSSAGDLYIRNRVSGTDNTTSNWAFQYLYAGSTSITAGQSSGGSYGLLGYIPVSAQHSFDIDLISPQETDYTFVRSLQMRNMATTAPNIQYNISSFNATTSFDGFSLIPQAGTITGSLRVYGYKN